MSDSVDEMESLMGTPEYDAALDLLEESERPLWGPEGPRVGQVITIAGTSMQTRWTGTHWELIR